MKECKSICSKDIKFEEEDDDRFTTFTVDSNIGLVIINKDNNS